MNKKQARLPKGKSRELEEGPLAAYKSEHDIIKDAIKPVKSKRTSRRLIPSPVLNLISDKNGEKTADNNLPKVTKSYPRRTMILVIFGALILIGFVFAIIYIFTYNIALGIVGIPFLFGGGLGFYYYWGQSKDIQVRHVGEVPTEQVNSLVIRRDSIKFEDIYDPKGFIWYWIDDGKPYYVYWENPETKRLEPYVLPDQQYYDPQVFAEMVLTLPCHRKIFQRRQDLMKKLKPFIAALIGFALWILIITTTGGNTGA